MSSIIKERIAEIKSEIQKLEAEVNLKKNVLKELESLNSTKKQKSSKRKNKQPRKGSLVEYLVTVLSESPVPMPNPQIVESLLKHGYKTNAKVSVNNLVPSSLSKRPDLFFRARHGVYGLIGKHQQTNQGD
ncbi:MAG: hypothetical protein PHY02_02165 [Phycisphaerae bacterium]|nr:hypothetical protein [Phycisphaerae bacterium]